MTISQASRSRWIAAGLGFQGLYYSVTGVWPLVSIQSFQAVTGRKTDHLVTGLESDHWLVMTVGVLILAAGVTFLYASRRPASREAMLLALLCATGLASIDVIYVARGVIWPIYLADAALEIPLALFWAFQFYRKTNEAPTGT